MKSLKYFHFKHNGRNSHGHITIRHRGGGAKRLFRVINFSYTKIGLYKQPLSIDYNPNKAGHLVLIKTDFGKFEYITAWNNISLSNKLIVGPNFKNFYGFSKPLWNIPLGSNFFNLELKEKKGAQISRASGSSCSLIALHKRFAVVKLPSKEYRLISNKCVATLGTVLNNKNYLKKKKKAGQNRWLGIRPTVRGVAMNPIDHPHGGGEGRCPVGHKSPMSPWGKPSHGLKTRHKPNKFLVSDKKIKNKK